MVLFSFNIGHFCRLHTEFLAQGKSHAGIVLAPQQRYGVGERVRRLLELASAKTTEEMRDQLAFLNRWT